VDIAIIGTGSMGSGLAKAFVGAGHSVYLTARSADTAEAASQAAGAIVATSPSAAAALADVIILAVPFGAAEDVARAIRPVVNGKVIVDVTNPAKADWSGPLFSGTDSGAERIATWLPEAHVVKAFNTLLANNIADSAPEGIKLDGYVAGDDAGAKATVLRLVESIGLNPIDVGQLAAARQLESLAWLNISLNMAPGSTWKTGWRLVGAPVSLAA
jgi:NADPH-dependent F420 reductase